MLSLVLLCSFNPSSNASNGDDEPFVNKVQVCQITGELDQNLDFISRAAIEDPFYEEVVQTLLQGKDLRALPSSHPALAYKNYWDELSYDEDYRVILYNAWVLVPLAARKTILDVLHQSHQGVTKTRAAARVRYFWPGMNNEIALRIQQCRLCQEIRPSQPMPLQSEIKWPRGIGCEANEILNAEIYILARISSNAARISEYAECFGILSTSLDIQPSTTDMFASTSDHICSSLG
ncbi:hypothetical protein TCAL_14072 [Tigriopus californicus]|uniref:RNA-directed DNA polymerase n=1 Tax=Tigriopus californicus TaxID=6832 RepID=A0A553PT67_TIGCA|nr:hypothetical protein TCAL_14072 [Tigriopus californicus]|eukprot:TCALIF_14072-PA protein Name:"Similar to K02A2.6 Uncharacterized protein K02A2.6 (Caenorhabditis elegans)" AED:0.21 eAED:0.49 QI:0/0/0/1/1/1/2/0/234